ncbi:hypothetical protein KDX14_27760 [Burkholderia cenocepacia]|uniref:hypothetical protein n=1 Tax=Burkholderia cenocepacia TaxID=95486 RepID=UPI001B954890|nr:hypothetical protein [Burkholderia cenocepacia]MBR8073327.1 hypothetical protein [Burkholderia cenocepacia]
MQVDEQVDDQNVDTQDIQDYRSTATEPGDDTAEPGDVEEQARALGWVPEEEYTGRAPWSDAESFLENHSKHNGQLRKALDRQAKELDALKKQMQGMDAAHKRIFDLQIKKQKEEFDQQIAFLKAQKREAIRAGEHDQAAEIDEQIDTLRERGPDLPEAPESTASKPSTPQQDWRKNPVLVEWAERNPWFERDEDLSAYAGGMGQQIRQQNPGMPFPELLEEVTRRVKRAFPHKFTRRGSPVEETTPGATSGSAGKGTYASLPKDAREMCDEAVAEGGITRQQWVELYYGYEERRKR